MKAFTPRSQNPATAELKKPPPPEDKGRQRWSCISLHHPESKLNLTSRLHHAKTLHTTASLLQPHSHH
ncbi:hypothetical protein F2Q68_00026246 [Brassica cretica]|uniref:Uncharacterized protein n=1 Tax=Brassica cretica TaxID=69181 RepID=A0A8S9IBL9_BRACR|nr:hypothetical protein F2Q68_00026246 [Brassica cretica]